MALDTLHVSKIPGGALGKALLAAADLATARGHLKIWIGTQAAYDAIVTKDPEMQYFVLEA